MLQRMYTNTDRYLHTYVVTCSSERQKVEDIKKVNETSKVNERSFSESLRGRDTVKTLSTIRTVGTKMDATIMKMTKACRCLT
jgi:hypothetical protein